VHLVSLKLLEDLVNLDLQCLVVLEGPAHLVVLDGLVPLEALILLVRPVIPVYLEYLVL
jgi:hypothetical protein